MVVVKPKTPPRYQRSGLAAEALRRALRQRVSYNKFHKLPGQLNPHQTNVMQQRVQQRTRNMQRTQPKLADYNPILKKLFLHNKQAMEQSHWRNDDPNHPHRNTNPGNQFPGPGGNTAPNIGAKPDPAAPPHIKVSKNGQLNLPYNYQFMSGALEAQENANSGLLDLQSADQQQNLEYQQAMRDAQQQQQEAQTQTLNNFAGRGLAFSTAYENANADVNRNYTNYFNDLNSQNTLFDQDIAQRRGAIENAFNDYIRRAALGYATELEPQAGELGYGKSRPNTSWDTPSRKDIRGAIRTKDPKKKQKPKKRRTVGSILRGKKKHHRPVGKHPHRKKKRGRR